MVPICGNATGLAAKDPLRREKQGNRGQKSGSGNRGHDPDFELILQKKICAASTTSSILQKFHCRLIG